jgi:trehalose/maltose hydrolase-like predicted phosphorylase
MVRGFCGLHVENGVLCFDPRLHRRWKTIELSLLWQGYPLRVRVEREALILEWQCTAPRRRGARRQLPVQVYGRPQRLEAGVEYVFPPHRRKVRKIETSGLF